MSDLTIKTNNIPRLLLDWNQLSDKEKKDFDWIKDGTESDHSFFRYMGSVYCLSEFMNIDSEMYDGWDGYHNQTAFSGVLIKTDSENPDYVVVGRYWS